MDKDEFEDEFEMLEMSEEDDVPTLAEIHKLPNIRLKRFKIKRNVQELIATRNYQ